MAYKELKTKHLQNYRSEKNYPVFLTNNTMKPLSETLTELGIAFTFPIEITDANGNETYYEESRGFWRKREYAVNCNQSYCETSDGFWEMYEWDDNGRVIDYKDSDGYWERYERDAKGRPTYHEDSNGFWCRWERDANGDVDYYEDSTGVKKGTPKSAKK